MNLISILITIYLVIGFIYALQAYQVFRICTSKKDRYSWRVELFVFIMLVLFGPINLIVDFFKRGNP